MVPCLTNKCDPLLRFLLEGCSSFAGKYVIVIGIEIPGSIDIMRSFKEQRKPLQFQGMERSAISKTVTVLTLQNLWNIKEKSGKKRHFSNLRCRKKKKSFIAGNVVIILDRNRGYISIISHRKSAHPGNIEVSCASCSYTTTRFILLAAHLKLCVLQKGIFKCEECPYKTSIAGNITRHKRKHASKHTEFPAFKCAICQQQFRTVVELSQHINMMDCCQSFMCAICQQQGLLPIV